MHINNQEKIKQNQSKTKFVLLIVSAFLCVSQLILSMLSLHSKHCVQFSIISFTITTINFIINYHIFISAFRAKPNTNFLIHSYLLLAFIYSIICFCLHLVGQSTFTIFYFEVVSTLVTLLAFNNYFQFTNSKIYHKKLKYQATKISLIFNLSFTIIAIITLITWWLINKNFLIALGYGINILLLSYPCYLSIIFTLPTIQALKKTNLSDVIFNKDETVEKLQTINLVLFDQNILTPQIKVTNVQPLQGNLTAKNLLQFFASIERHNNHPIATAILKTYNNPSAYLDIESIQYSSDNCIKASLGNRPIYLGSAKFIAPYLHQADRNKAQALEEHYQAEGKITLICATNDKLLGIIALTEVIPDDTIKAFQKLKSKGIRTVMLAEENQLNIKKYTEIGIDKVITKVAKSERKQYVDALKKAGYRILVIDSDDKSPAFQSANISLLFNKNTSSSVDIVTSNNPFEFLYKINSLHQQINCKIKRSLFWPFLYNTLCLPFVTGALSRLIPFIYNPIIVSFGLFLGFMSVIISGLTIKIKS